MTIRKGFWLGQHEVTQREYKAVMEPDDSFFTGDPDRPAEMMFWDWAEEYCVRHCPDWHADSLPGGSVTDQRRVIQRLVSFPWVCPLRP